MSSINPKHNRIIKISNVLLLQKNYKGLFIFATTSLYKTTIDNQTIVISYYSKDITNKDKYLVDITDPNCTANIIESVNAYITANDFYNAFNCYIVNLDVLIDLNCKNVIIKYFDDYVLNNHSVKAIVQKYIIDHMDEIFSR